MATGIEEWLGIEVKECSTLSDDEIMQGYAQDMWYKDKKGVMQIDENVFAEAFTEVNHLRYNNGLFYTRNGKATEELLSRDVWESLRDFGIKRDVERTTKKMIGAVKLASTVPALTINTNVIPLQASTIAWDSEYSSMSADGILTCQGATINGTLHSGLSGGNFIQIEEGCIHGGPEGGIGYDNFIDFRGVFGDGDGPYIKGDNVTFEGDIHVIDNDTVYTGYSGEVKIPTSIRSDGTVARWLNISFVNGILVQ